MAALHDLTQPRFYSSYTSLSPGDVVVSIEHCHNCHMHNITLRHNSADYVTNADRIFSQFSTDYARNKSEKNKAGGQSISRRYHCT